MFKATMFLAYLTVSGCITQACAAATVILDNATVTGINFGFTNRFLGIPFAQPPTGNLRFRLPQPLPPYDTNFSATTYGPACPQQAFNPPLPLGLPAETIDYLINTVYNVYTPSAEDCLTLNVITPANASPTSKLPVVVWIFGGSFAFGGTSVDDGNVIVEKGISLSVPVIYVSMNYRLNAFGFLASQEVKDAGVGNLGLQDQRLALKWVQKYINAFGGDSTKVTIWGQSAGAISAALHMITNGGNPDGLFRAAFMQSGSVVPVGDITHGQPYYDALVAETGCSGALNTLQCLREVPYQTLLHAVNQSPGLYSYQSLYIVWLPRVDGVFLTAEPFHLVQQGVIADIPFIAGDSDDEGTPFSFVSTNVTTDAEFEEYIQTYWFRNDSSATVKQVMKYYPSDPTKGSPFDTGHLNALTPQFKRIAALLGDLTFQAPRRFLSQNWPGKQSRWMYLNKRLKATPFLGSFHSSDVFLNAYVGLDITSYLVRFVANLDPNVGEGEDLYWPQYDAANKTMLELLDGLVPQSLTTDTYRAEEMAFLINVVSAVPV